MFKAEIPRDSQYDGIPSYLKYGAVGFLLLGSLVACQKGGATTSASPAARQQTLRATSPLTKVQVPSAETTPVVLSVAATPETSTQSVSIITSSETPTPTIAALPSSVSTSPNSRPWPLNTGEQVGSARIAAIANTVASQLNDLRKSPAVTTQTRNNVEGNGYTVYLMSKQHGTNSQLPLATSQLVYARGGELIGVSLQTGNDVVVPGMASDGVYHWPTAHDTAVNFNRSNSDWTAAAVQSRTQYVLQPNAGATGPQEVVTPDFMQQLAGHIVQEL